MLYTVGASKKGKKTPVEQKKCSDSLKGDDVKEPKETAYDKALRDLKLEYFK